MTASAFTYDPLGRRIRKQFASATTIYAYDGENMVEETEASGIAVARYAMGLSIDEPLAMLRSSATHYYSTDGLGSVTSLTDGSGTVAASYAFDAFGNIAASSGSLVNPFRYTSREWDSETGLYFYRARYYDQANGRFLSEDPIAFAAGPNFYSYVGNNAANLVDPTGHDGGATAVTLVAPLIPWIEVPVAGQVLGAAIAGVVVGRIIGQVEVRPGRTVDDVVHDAFVRLLTEQPKAIPLPHEITRDRVDPICFDDSRKKEDRETDPTIKCWNQFARDLLACEEAYPPGAPRAACIEAAKTTLRFCLGKIPGPVQ